MYLTIKVIKSANYECCAGLFVDVSCCVILKVRLSSLSSIHSPRNY